MPSRTFSNISRAVSVTTEVSRPKRRDTSLYYANSRVELFARDGKFDKTIPLPSTTPAADIAFNGQGRLFVLSYADSVLELPTQDGEKIVDIPVVPRISPVELVADGTDLWVAGQGPLLYKVFQESGPVPPEKQVSGEQAGVPPGAVPAGLVAFQTSRQDRTSASLVITDLATGSTIEVPVNSPDLPPARARVLGYDAAGNLYAMVLIYEEHWTGTVSWCFIGVSPDGEYLGQLRLPWDDWAGGSWAVTPGGKILELRSTAAGIVLTEYALKR